MHRSLRRALSCGLSALLFASAPLAAQAYSVRTVATGLNSPRGLAVGPDGSLYIAESGIPAASPGLGASGSITRVTGTTQTRIVSSLPSLTGPMGEATGPQDIAFLGGVGYVLLGLGADPAVRAGSLGGGAALGLGSLWQFTGVPTPVKIADLSNYEASFNPLGGALDSNPFHLVPGGTGFLVTDAGSNTLLSVTTGGAVSLVSGFAQHPVGPSPASDSVPTGVAVAPDGTIYVAELTGAPFTAGFANIYHLAADGTRLNVLTGFTDITDIAFGRDGALYVLEFDADGIIGGSNLGALIRVGSDGSRQTIFNDGLVAPTGLAVGNDGSFFVSAFSPAAGIGRVFQVAPVPEPASWTMMIVGFLMAGAALRRRRPVAAIASA